MKTNADTVRVLREQIEFSEADGSEWCEIDAPGVARIADDLEAYHALAQRLEAWAAQLDASGTTLYDGSPSGVGPFIAAELRNRMAGTP